MTRNRPVLFGLLGALALLAGAAGEARPSDLTEDEVKAAFLFSFSKFVTWPAEAFPEKDSSLEIGVVGHDEFAEILEATVKGKSVGGRAVRVVRFADARRARACPILYFSGDLKVSGSAREWTGQRGILTIGEQEGFASREGIIGFFLEKSRVRFEVNTAAAERAGLKISSQVLGLARLVGDAPTEGGDR
ncbi:MAG: YfiR family protein [Candidatus Eisenbacteria bacterium]